MDSNTLIFTLLLAGLMAGGVNFFISYLDLPFKSSNKLLEDNWPRPRELWLAILGYLLVGVVGAFLTPLINVLVGLKGYYSDKEFLVVFGYGLVFGYSTTRLLVNVLDSLLKRLNKIEKNIVAYEHYSPLEILKTEPQDPFSNPMLAPTDAAGKNTNAARFGCSRNGGTKWHGGIDLKARIGTDVKAIYGGYVQVIRDDVPNDSHTPGVGNFVIIRSNQKNFSIKYCHLSLVSVEEGNVLGPGDSIGKSGQSGNAYGVPHSHLHIEVSTDYFATKGNYIDPEPHLLTKYQPSNPNDPDKSKCPSTVADDS